MELGREFSSRDLQEGFLPVGRPQIIEYERGNPGSDDFVIIRFSNGTYREPSVNDTYPFDAKLIINTNSAKLTINIPGN